MAVEWEGVDGFSRWLKETPGITVRAVEEATYREGERVMGASKRRTPVDTGRLRSTGHATPPETRGGVTTVSLNYGTDYAIYVHERPAHHNVGRAKFLESAVYDAAADFTKRIKATIEEVVSR